MHESDIKWYIRCLDKWAEKVEFMSLFKSCLFFLKNITQYNLFFFWEEDFSLFEYQEKLKWFTAMLCVYERVCVCVFPDNLFKHRDRAITGKEMQLRSKWWVPSQSAAADSSLSLPAFACEGRTAICDISIQICRCFSAKTFALIMFIPFPFLALLVYFPSCQIHLLIRKEC